MILLAGDAMQTHKVVDEITVQCLDGSVDFSMRGTHLLMRTGDLKCLAGGEEHALKPVEDCSVLVPILLHGT